jgi:hypothetical protein
MSLVIRKCWSMHIECSIVTSKMNSMKAISASCHLYCHFWSNRKENSFLHILRSCDRASKTNFFIIKPTRCTNFTNLFWHETLLVSDSSSVHHQEFIHCTLSNCICHTVFEQDPDGTPVPPWSCSKVVYKLVWHIPMLSVQWVNSWWRTEELSETCRVSGQNKFVKLVHLVGFIIKTKVFYT